MAMWRGLVGARDSELACGDDLAWVLSGIGLEYLNLVHILSRIYPLDRNAFEWREYLPAAFVLATFSVLHGTVACNRRYLQPEK